MTAAIQLLAVPLILVVTIWTIRKTRTMTVLAASFFWIQSALVASVLYPVLCGQESRLVFSADFSIDRLAALFAMLTQIVVASSMTHAHLYFLCDGAHGGTESGVQLRMFYTCATLFLVSMTFVFFCENLGLLWISVEASTLCAAPLVYYRRTKHAIEAAWKYLMICSVGIAFALFGTMFIFASSQYGAVVDGSLLLNELHVHASELQYPLLRLGFLFCLLGYGTKAGIFPLHSWMPDTYSETPAPACAMLSGSLLNCALFAVWRISELVVASGHILLVHCTATYAGVLTVLMASVLLIRQHGIKRLFAYSSIENVGLMVTAIGLGSGPLFFLLSLNHSIAKVALFLLTGNIIQSSGTKSLKDIRGLLVVNPYWAAILAAGAFAVTGAPPFGAFAAEWQLLALVTRLQLWPLLTVLLIALTLSFLSVTMHLGNVICGTPRPQAVVLPAVASSVIPAALVLLTLLLGTTALPNLFL
ncbi:MAG: hypothetical protein K2W95_02655 [Candidatus Obscuribacterales bacterium]|nr:hypothetical protein [Candidatus Obscuribacterales bacterium]